MVIGLKNRKSSPSSNFILSCCYFSFMSQRKAWIHLFYPQLWVKIVVQIIANQVQTALIGNWSRRQNFKLERESNGKVVHYLRKFYANAQFVDIKEKEAVKSHNHLHSEEPRWKKQQEIIQVSFPRNYGSSQIFKKRKPWGALIIYILKSHGGKNNKKSRKCLYHENMAIDRY